MKHSLVGTYEEYIIVLARDALRVDQCIGVRIYYWVLLAQFRYETEVEVGGSLLQVYFAEYSGSIIQPGFRS